MQVTVGENENGESAIRRFRRAVMNSGHINEVRSARRRRCGDRFGGLKTPGRGSTRYAEKGLALPWGWWWTSRHPRPSAGHPIALTLKTRSALGSAKTQSRIRDAFAFLIFAHLPLPPHNRPDAVGTSRTCRTSRSASSPRRERKRGASLGPRRRRLRRRNRRLQTRAVDEAGAAAASSAEAAGSADAINN